MKGTEVKKCRIYLTEWQQRMFSDLAGKDVMERFRVKVPRWVEIAIGPVECVASYKIPPEGIRVGDWVLYLDAAQVAQVREELGVPADVFEINVSMKEIEAGHISFA